MNVKFEINGKALLAFALLSAGLAFGDFVTVADVKTSGGITTPGMTESDKEDLLLESMPVGSVSLRMDSKNPSTIYGGTWQLITGDASLRLGSGSDVSSAAILGNNTPVVPVPQHSHTTSHSLKTASAGAHTHTSSTYTGGGSNTTTMYNGGGSNRGTWTSSSSGNHTHTITGAVTVNSTGTANAKLDVRGAYVVVNVWKRIS